MDLDGMTRDQLLAEAKKLELTGLSQKDKPTIKDAVLKAIEARDAEAKMREEEGVPPDPTPEQLEGEALTADQAETLRRNSTANIETALEDSSLTRQRRLAFQAELDIRAAAAAAAAEKKRLTSPMQGYLITKGGPLVINGRITQVRTGGVVYETTHDLALLKRLGIEYEPLKGHVEVVKGALGFATTKIVHDP